MIGKRTLARAGGAISRARTRVHNIFFAGGWDNETPPISVPSGFVRKSKNYECGITGGYSRVIGYERHDGRTSPSAATAVVIDIALTGAISVGDTVTGVTSAATAVAIATASGYIAVTKVVGTFVSGEVLNVGGLPQATTTSAVHGASTALLRAQYKNLAADLYRADIAAPTGSGNSLGGVRFGGVSYCWRNNAGGTAAVLWKSSSTGWQEVTLFNEISFTAGGLTDPAEGSTLTQGANTALIKRVVRTSGSWAAGTAAGRLIVTTPAPGNFAAGAATVGAINLTLSGAQAAITLLPGGRFLHIVSNFAGGTNTNRVYGCDGVNRGFEFDGTVLVPITTGMTSDAPSHVHAHKNHLFFSFVGSVQHSGPGTPYIWSAIVGAGEIGMGDTVTGFQTQPGSETVGALAIFTRNQTSILYGTGVANWQLISYRAEIGAYAYTIQDIGYTLFLDDQGITSFKTVQAFGNFSHQALSARIKTWLNGKRPKVADSCVSRDKGQYRLFFSDGYALFFTFTKRGGMMQVQFPIPVTWVYSSEEPDGTEMIYFGSTNGMVYQMERGTSFDGEPIVHDLYLAWDWLKSLQLIKRFHNASIEVSGTGYAEFSFGYRLGYGSTEIAQPGTQTEVTNFSASVWNQVVWNNFVWNGQTLLPSLVDMGGEAENVSLIVSGSSDYHESIKFSSAAIHFAPRRHLR